MDEREIKKFFPNTDAKNLEELMIINWSNV